jgi:hypothetical protein
MDPNCRRATSRAVRPHADPGIGLLEPEDHASPEGLAAAEAPDEDRVDDDVTHAERSVQIVRGGRHHRTRSPSAIAPRTMSPMKRCSTTIAPAHSWWSSESCSSIHRRPRRLVGRRRWI